jgi:hypothetical protein
MNVYVGMDVHRKRSQIAVVDAAGGEQRNRNVSNDPVKLVPILVRLANRPLTVDVGRLAVSRQPSLDARRTRWHWRWRVAR